MNQDLNKYKFRAECALDASIFKSLFDNEIQDLNVEHDVELPDVYVDFQSELSLNEIKKTLRPFAILKTGRKPWTRNNNISRVNSYRKDMNEEPKSRVKATNKNK